MQSLNSANILAASCMKWQQPLANVKFDLAYGSVIMNLKSYAIKGRVTSFRESSLRASKIDRAPKMATSEYNGSFSWFRNSRIIMKTVC